LREKGKKNKMKHRKQNFIERKGKKEQDEASQEKKLWAPARWHGSIDLFFFFFFF
jgi:hypothetical protein